MLPALEPIDGPTSSSSACRPQSRRYARTRSATARSSPGGLGTAASSVKRSRTSATRATLRHFGVRARSSAVVGRRDESEEERRRARGARLELRMELRRDEPRMVGELDDLDQSTLLEGAAD